MTTITKLLGTITNEAIKAVCVFLAIPVVIIYQVTNAVARFSQSVGVLLSGRISDEGWQWPK